MDNNKSKKISICFITTIPGTIQSFILPLAQYLHSVTNWEISFICSDNDEFEQTLPDYIHYYPVHMERGISVSGIRAIFEIKKILKKQKFDLIQYSTPNASLYVTIATKFVKVPIRLYCQWGIAYVGFSGIKRKFFKAIEKYVCKSATWIEPDSKSNLKFAHDEKLYDEKKSSVIWNGSACGVNLSKFDINKKDEYRYLIRKQYSIPKDDFVYIFIGRVTRDKGINELLSAFKSVENERTHLFVIGRNETDSSVNTELLNWSLKNKSIVYTGNVNNVEQFLAASDCYVLPSYREGFGLSVIEAEAMGLPVIVTDIPGPIDAMIEDETGYVVKKADSGSLIAAMEKIQTIDSVEMGKKGHRFVIESFEQQQLFTYITEDRKRLLNDNQNTFD